jgi:drug/metabolite transporter (DMT)-like permease
MGGVVAERVERIGLGLMLGAVGVVIFGGTLPFTRLAVAGLDPWFVTVGRAAIAGILAGIVLLATRRRLPDAASLRTLALVSLCLVAGFPAFSALAMTRVEASHGGVVLGILPLVTAIFAIRVAGERPAALFWLAAIAGAAIVTAFTLRGGTGAIGLGELWLAGTIISGALGYVLSGVLARRMPGWEVISWALVMALPIAIPAAIALWPADAAIVPASSWWGFAYVTLMSQYLAFFAWNAGLAMGGVSRVSQVQLLQIFVTLIIAGYLNNEHIDGITWLVAALVVVIVRVASRARMARA